MVAAMPASGAPVNHTIVKALQDERDFLIACVRAELEKLRRGEGSLQVADGLSGRLNEVDALIFRTLTGAR